MGLSNSKSVEQRSYDDPDTENIMKILSEVDGISNISKEYVEILKQNIYELERENEILRNNAEKYKKMYYDKIEEIRETILIIMKIKFLLKLFNCILFSFIYKKLIILLLVHLF